MVSGRRLLIAVGGGVHVLMGHPPNALAHAVLAGLGAALGLHREAAPVKQVVFKFSEPVEGSFGAIRVFDRQGQALDNGDVFHPGGRARSWA